MVRGTTRAEYKDKKFGRLEILYFSHCKNNMAYWMCRCDCGTEKTTQIQSVLRGSTRSCGCLQKDIARSRALPDIEAYKNSIYLSIKDGSDRRTFVWQLTKERVWELSQSNCTYCGIGPSNTIRYRRDSHKPIKYNGLDRINSKEGYTYYNVVPCCRTCNIAKRDMEVKDFLDWAERLYKHSFEGINAASA